MRLNRVAYWVAGLGLLVVLAVIYGWSQRIPIADNFVARELAARGIHATYRLEQVGPQTQRVTHVVVGDAQHPDLTARLVEVDIAYWGFQPHITAVRASGVRLFGRFDGSTLKLGEIDKLRGGSSGTSGLPDMRLDLTDARARIDTPAGPVGLVLNGAGNLRSGFTGRLGAVMRDVAQGGCRVPGLTLWGAVTSHDQALGFDGPLRATALACPRSALAATDLVALLSVRWKSGDGAITGRARMTGAKLDYGAVRVAAPSSSISFTSAGTQWTGRLAAAARTIASGSLATGFTRVEGDWALATAGGNGPVASARAQLDARGVQLDKGNGLAALTRSLSATPLGPLADKLSAAVRAAGRDNRFNALARLDSSAEGSRLAVSDIAFVSRSGVHMTQSRGTELAWDSGSGVWTGSSGLAIEGGGMPRAALHIKAEQAGLVGQAFVDPYGAEAARAAFETVRFATRPTGGWTIRTAVTLDGPLPGGLVGGLSIPLVFTADGRGTTVVNPGCTPVRWSVVRVENLTLASAGARLCALNGALVTIGPRGARGGGAVRGLALTGRLGTSPVRLSADDVRYSLADGRLAAANAALVLGGGDAPVRLSAARLSGAPGRAGWTGSFAGVKARIATVPVLVDGGDANWRFADGRLAVSGAITVIDDATPDRFNPLMMRDFQLTMAKGRIGAQGTLTLPRGSASIAAVTVSHDFATASGHADFSLPPLQFDPALQPEDISHIALGVVANVRGTLAGQGQIRWTDDTVSSTGEFSTDNTDLAAAFGPVSGLATRIRFTDLLGLVTAPGQRITMKSANPGVDVRDGVVDFSLRPGQSVAIEGGHWPFAGGDLTLLPGTMDFSAEKPRHLTFRVIGLDAGSFINTLELDNISATGTFDGLLPMVFDASGGRIVGGIMVARQQGQPPLVIDHIEGLTVPCDRTLVGGTLSYVGAVSNENLGRFGRLAFDALKDLQYKCLTILMDGALDGEVVTQVTFNGINRGELSAVPKIVSRQFTGLPFIFNIKIAAPFRGLINTARSFVDPGLLIRSHLGDQFEPVITKRGAAPPGPAPGNTVQPRESEKTVSGDRK